MMTSSLAMPRQISNRSIAFIDNNSLVHGPNGLRHSVVPDNMIGGSTVLGGDIMPGHRSKVVRGGNIVYEG